MSVPVFTNVGNKLNIAKYLCGVCMYLLTFDDVFLNNV